MPKQVILGFPAELPEESLRDPEVLQKGKTAVVLELLRKGSVSQGWAAEVLEIDPHTLFDLMAKYDIPATELTEEELRQELATPCGQAGSVNDDHR